MVTVEMHPVAHAVPGGGKASGSAVSVVSVFYTPEASFRRAERRERDGDLFPASGFHRIVLGVQTVFERLGFSSQQGAGLASFPDLGGALCDKSPEWRYLQTTHQ